MNASLDQRSTVLEGGMTDMGQVTDVAAMAMAGGVGEGSELNSYFLTPGVVEGVAGDIATEHVQTWA